MFLIENNHTPIGMVGIDWREPEAPELGYWLGVEYWGQGFATEAARAVIDFTFEEFDVEHLISGARVANPSSRNILEKCGFQWSGVELHRFEALGSLDPGRLLPALAQCLVVAEKLGQFDAAMSGKLTQSSRREAKHRFVYRDAVSTKGRGWLALRRDDGGVCFAGRHTGGLTTVSPRPRSRSRRKI